ncbi:MAG: cell division protein FtsW [Lachnospiraceae bacterium]|nr:cell division protein FtsW [Lachnospiraceae bacterium]
MSIFSPKKRRRGLEAARAREWIPFKDYTLFFVIIALLLFGLVMLYSITSYQGQVMWGDPGFYFNNQARYTAAGLAIMFVAAYFPYAVTKQLAVPVYLASVVSVLLTLTPLGYSANGATRWLDFKYFNVQPAEIVKVGVIFLTASIIDRLGTRVNTIRGFIIPLIPAGIAALMIWKITRNMSSAIIVMAIVMGMLFVACPFYKPFIAMAALVIAGGGYWIYHTVETARESGVTADFRGERILAWLNPQAYADNKAYQTLQALYAIGSGGIFGKGLGQSMQKLGHVPELQNDMIFSIICEELGLFGAIAVMLIYLFLIWRLAVIASNTADLYGALLVIGVMTHIAVQVILNIAVVTNTIPNTGVTLPFISYGGTSILLLLAEIGVVMSVSRKLGIKKPV